MAPFLKGAIVIVVPDGGCSVQEHALVAQNAGASAALVLTYSTFLFAAALQTDGSKIEIPVLFIEVDDFTKYLASEMMNIVLMKVEGNKVKKKKFFFIIFFFIKKEHYG